MILDFRLGAKTMNRGSCGCDGYDSYIPTIWNSKIENLKWLGLSVIAFVLVVTGVVAQAQQPKQLPRIGYLAC